MSTISSSLSEQGYALVDCPPTDEGARAHLHEAMLLLGSPLHVFLRHPFWKPIGVDPSRPAGRSEGAGLNSLHIDCVNMRRPPRYVVLLCLRSDPHGGGHSLICDTSGVAELLSAPSRATISRLRIPSEPVYDLQHVGEALPSYRLDEGDGFLRYSGRYLDDYGLESEERAALLELDRLLMLRTSAIPLAPFQALIVDQCRILHGRLALHSRAGAVSRDRLLVQAFFGTPT